MTDDVETGVSGSTSLIVSVRREPYIAYMVGVCGVRACVCVSCVRGFLNSVEGHLKQGQGEDPDSAAVARVS